MMGGSKERNKESLKRLESLTIIMAILSISLYSFSWLFKAMDWKGEEYVKISAVFPFFAGAIMLLIYNIRKSREKRKSLFEDDDE